jgi:hypothetical protein
MHEIQRDRDEFEPREVRAYFTSSELAGPRVQTKVQGCFLISTRMTETGRSTRRTLAILCRPIPSTWPLFPRVSQSDVERACSDNTRNHAQAKNYWQPKLWDSQPKRQSRLDNYAMPGHATNMLLLLLWQTSTTCKTTSGASPEGRSVEPLAAVVVGRQTILYIIVFCTSHCNCYRCCYLEA